MKNTARKNEVENFANMQVLKNENVVIENNDMPDFKDEKEFLKTTEEKKEPEIKAEEKKQIEIKPLSIDDKVQRVKELNLLTERREKLIDSRNKLKEFVIGSTSENQKLEIKDSTGKQYNINNTEAITEVKQLLINFLNRKISEVEKLIEF